MHRTGVSIYSILENSKLGLKTILYVETISRNGLDSYKIPVRDFLGHTEAVNALACAGDCSFLVSGSTDATVRVWSPDSLLHVFIGHSSGVSAVAISKDMKLIASGSQELIVWDLETLEQVCRISFDARLNGLKFVDQRLVVCLEDGLLLMLDLNAWKPMFSKHLGIPLTSLAVDPDRRQLAVGTRGDRVLLFNLEDYAQTDSFPMSGGSESLSFSPDGQFLAVAGRGGKIYVWNRSTGEVQERKAERGLPVRSLAFSPDSSILLGAGVSGDLQVWNGNSVPRIVHVINSPINSVVVAEDGDSFVTGASDGSIFIHSIDGQLERHFPGQARVCSVTSDGDSLAAGIQQSTLHVWDLKSMEFIEGAKEDGWINSISISARGDYVATGSKDNLVRLWNAKTMGVDHAFIGHRLPVKSVAFSPDGSLLVSGSSDRTVRIWDVQAKSIKKVLEVPHWVQTVAFSSEGDVIGAQLINGEVHRWRADDFVPLEDDEGMSFPERLQWMADDFNAYAVAETVILECPDANRFQNVTNWVQSSETCFSRMT